MYPKTLILFLIVNVICDYSSVHAQSDEDTSYIDQLRQMVIEACNENVGEHEMSLVEDRLNDFQSCASRVINLDIIDDLFLAKQRGNVAETSMRLCAKSAESKICATKLSYAVSKCITPDSVKELNILITLYKRAVDFACYQNATALTQFVEQDGLTCIATQHDKLQHCIEAYPNDKELGGLNQLSKCFVGAVSRCRLMPALILHGMFSYVQQGIPKDTQPATTERIIRRIRETAQGRM